MSYSPFRKSTFKLLKEASKGNPRSQRKIYEEYYGYGMSVALRFSANREEAMEAVHDSFIKVFNNFDQIESEQSFKAWLRRIVVNTSIDHFRRSRHHHFHDDLEDVEAPVNDSILAQMSAEEILAMISKLSPAYRMVFTLYVVEGYKHNEIAERLGISIGTSKSNLAKARIKLKEDIIKHFPAYAESYE